MKILLSQKVKDLIDRISAAFADYHELERADMTLPQSLKRCSDGVYKCVKNEMNKKQQIAEKYLKELATLIGCKIRTNMYWSEFIGADNTKIVVVDQECRAFIEVQFSVTDMEILNPHKIPQKVWELKTQPNLYEALVKVYLLSYILGWWK